MYFYTELDKNDIVFSVGQLSGEITSNNMIQIEILDFSLLGKKYNRETKAFETVKAV